MPSVKSKQKKVGQIINVPDWSDALPELRRMSDAELVATARAYAKRSNQRLVKLEQQGFSASYAYEQVTTNLQGQYESPEAAERGHASYATKSGKRFIESSKQLGNLSRGQLYTMLQQMTYHLRRQTSAVSRVKELADTRFKGMRAALATIEHTSMKKIKERYTDAQLMQIFESEAYRVLRSMFGYKQATQQLRDAVVKNDKTFEALETDLKKAREEIQAYNRGKEKSEWRHLESTDAYDRFARYMITGGK